MLQLGYNTNGLSDHSCEQALRLIAENGFQSVALTIDHHLLNPYADDFNRQLQTVQRLLEELELQCVIETGARYLLNPRVKHEPTLLSASTEQRDLRVQFLKHCIDIAAELNSGIVSCWSGVLRDSISQEQALNRLIAGCNTVLEYAEHKRVKIAFEPEPDMFIDTMQSYATLSDQIDAEHFGLTIDIGHLHCLEPEPIPFYLKRWSDKIWNVHIEDMKKQVHEHLPFGEGEIEFQPVIATLIEIGYAGGVHVELSRHSHVGPVMAQQSHQFLSRLIDQQ